MADVSSPDVRSVVMKQVKSKQNKSTELRLIEYFREQNIVGWKRNYNVKGHPDFVFLEKKVAVFVDGCFWHGHNCRNITPSSNVEYWKKKQSRNKQHDEEITTLFQSRGWKVVRIWECELQKKNRSILKNKLAVIFE